MTTTVMVKKMNNTTILITTAIFLENSNSFIQLNICDLQTWKLKMSHDMI